MAPRNSSIFRVTYVFLASQERPVSEASLHNKAVQVVFSRKHVYDDADLSFINIDPYTGKVLRIDSAENRSLGDVISAWIPSIHFGTFGGITTQILWFFLGLTPAVLAVTGLLMWWNRVLSKKLAKWRVQTRATKETSREPVAVEPGL